MAQTTAKKLGRTKSVHPLKQSMRMEISTRFKDVAGGVVVRYRGLNSEKIYDLRAKLHAKGAKLSIVKNALAMRAFAELGYDAKKLGSLFDGPVGVVYGRDAKTGPVEAAKALLDWKRDTKDKLVEIRGGFLEGSIIDAPGVKALAEMPSREQLLGMVAGAFQAPIAAFATVLKESVAKLAYAIEAVRKKQEGAGASPTPTPAG